jgi:hypothetical protein
MALYHAFVTGEPATGSEREPHPGGRFANLEV